MEIGEKLRNLRIQKNLTQEELASVIGLSRQRRIARLKKETPKWHGAYIWHSYYFLGLFLQHLNC